MTAKAASTRKGMKELLTQRSIRDQLLNIAILFEYILHLTLCPPLLRTKKTMSPALMKTF